MLNPTLRFYSIFIMFHSMVSRSTAFQRILPYQPPLWAQEYLKTVPPHGRWLLANLPTPLYQLISHNHDASILSQTFDAIQASLFIKRDDSTGGVELGGNKIRKLEFLLADAVEQNCDCVVTIGGIQSNHCRATASASRMLGLEPHLILRTRNVEEVGWEGNLLINRMMKSVIYTCTPGEYGKMGSDELVRRLCQHLVSQGRKPYSIPVGGSNGIGSWGYINAVDELMQQWETIFHNRSLDHVVFACGSGGTATGIAIGMALYHLHHQSSKFPKVHAIGVCDDPEYFIKYVTNISDQMGLTLPSDTSTEDFVRKHLHVVQGKGLGYAMSSTEELSFLRQFAIETGIVLDPVYSGKALYNFCQMIRQDPESYHGSNILFWHTGGALGLYDKVGELEGDQTGAVVNRLDIYGKGNGINLNR